MALGNPIDAWMQMAQAKNQNRQQMNQDIGSIGQSLGQGFNTIGQQLAEKKKKAQWQQTINQMMVNPNTPPQLKTMLPIFAQHPELMGNLGAALSKQTAPKATFRAVPGVMSKTGHPIVIDEMTGKEVESGIDAKSTAGRSTDLGDVKWESATPDEQKLGIALYNGDVRPYDLGYRERSKAVVLANQYADRNGLAPYRSFGGDVKAKSTVAFTSGKPAMNTLALNTALGHLDSAYEAYKKVGNLGEEFLNQPMNFIRQKTNNPDIIRLMATLNAVRGESANVFKGSGATDQEISSWQKSINENLTPKQYMAVIKQMDDLYRSRLSALDYMREQGQNTRPGTGSLLSPHAAALSGKLSQVGNDTPAQTTAFPDKDKEARYQAWKKSQGL